MIDDDLFRHYRFEEEIVFPRLAEVGLSPITDMLSMEHETIRGLADGLRSAAIVALESGFTSASWSEFRDGVMDLVHSVNFHIQKEEMGVIRQLDMVLGAGVDRELGVLYAAFV
jgi:hemerythrin-like domain-containing protein